MDTELKSSKPSVTKIGEDFGFRTFTIINPIEINQKISEVLKTDGHTICEVVVDKDQQIVPRMVFLVKPDGKWVSKPLEDMYLFLDRKVLKEYMIIDVFEDF